MHKPTWIGWWIIPLFYFIPLAYFATAPPGDIFTPASLKISDVREINYASTSFLSFNWYYQWVNSITPSLYKAIEALSIVFALYLLIVMILIFCAWTDYHATKGKFIEEPQESKSESCCQEKLLNGPVIFGLFLMTPFVFVSGFVLYEMITNPH